MNKRTGSKLTMLSCSVTLTLLSGNVFSQNLVIDPTPDDCMVELQNDDAKSMDARLSCYNHKLDNLTQVLSGLINERKNLNDVIGSYDTNALQPNIADNSLANKQQQKIQQLQLERAELRAQLHRLISEKQPQQLAKETDERLFRNYSEAYASLTVENSELRKLLNEYQTSATNHQAAATALQSTVEQQSDHVTRLNDEIATLKLTIADLSTRKKKLSNKFNTTESRIGLMKKQLLANAALIKLQRDSTDSLQQSLTSRAEEIDIVNQESAQLKKKNAETIGSLITTKEQLYTQINTLTAELDQTRKQTKQNTSDTAAALSDSDQQISALSNELKDLQTAHEEITAKLVSVELESGDINRAYSAEITQLSESNSNLDANNLVLTDTIAARNTTIERLQNQINEHNKQMDLSTQKIASLDSALIAAKTSATELTEANRVAINSNSDLTDQLQTRLGQINALQNERDRLAAELNVARPEIVSLTKSVETKDAQSTDLAQLVTSLQSEIEQADTDTANLQEKLAASKENNVTANEKVKTLTAAVATLENILSESLNSNQHIEASLADIKSDLNASQERLESKQSQLQQLIAEKNALIESHNALTNESEKLVSDIRQKLTVAGVETVAVTRLEDNSLVLKVDSSQLFRTGSSNLSTAGQALLSSVGNAIGNIENRRIMIEGHSDNVPLGEKLSAIFKDNLGLSMARALSTAKFFTNSANIPANQMSITGAGATKPLASNQTIEGRQSNRRVEILLLPVNSDPLASIKQ